MATTADAKGVTTDEPTADQQQRVLDLDSARPVSIDGATVIEADAFARTDDDALRFDGSEPLFVVGIVSRTKARHALADAGHDHAAIERAFALGAWMEAEKPAHAREAVRVAEQADSEAQALTADRQGGLVADGGERR